MSPAPQPPKKAVGITADPALAQMTARYHELKPYTTEFDQLKKDIKARMHSLACDQNATVIGIENLEQPLHMRWVARTEFSVKRWRADNPGDVTYDETRGRWELRDG